MADLEFLGNSLLPFTINWWNMELGWREGWDLGFNCGMWVTCNLTVRTFQVPSEFIPPQISCNIGELVILNYLQVLIRVWMIQIFVCGPKLALIVSWKRVQPHASLLRASSSVKECMNGVFSLEDVLLSLPWTNNRIYSIYVKSANMHLDKIMPFSQFKSWN